jgi:hypothetical protein
MRLESDHDSQQFYSDGKRGTQFGRRPLDCTESMSFQPANRKVTIQGNERRNNYSREGYSQVSTLSMWHPDV